MPNTLKVTVDIEFDMSDPSKFAQVGEYMERLKAGEVPAMPPGLATITVREPIKRKRKAADATA